jgi:hypothetical protein
MKPTQEEIEQLIALGEWKAEDFEEQDEHTCPFQEDVNNNSEKMCKCSAYDTYQCAQDI